ncbi:MULTISPECIES: SDR family NAD(P)-dependent oxidoreductase [Dickeya]|uniref:Short-chain dehydrogenase/reductase SDR n=1 Tax=Dickeya aquatica TaxID=1401087 RepID=A0A375A565_9GAMM|nr:MULTISPECIES: SDR family NAD(P)-dependent oxidoreductase [Dickeya]SLM61192.1 Short-chain dehydrogenase/reductase SDR [Dickeya aquatica]
MKLENKRILLTGAISDIGQELALLLAAKGARLYLAGHNEPALLGLIRRLPNPSHHNILLADLSDEQDRSALAECFPDNARLDILINYIGPPVFRLFATQDYTAITDQLMSTIQAPILLTHALLDCLGKPGIIMNISPALGIGYPGYSVYCAGEAALHRFSEALSHELSYQGVKVLHLSPQLPRGVPDLQAGTQQEPLTCLDSAQQVAQQAASMLEKESTHARQSLRDRLLVCLRTLMPSVADSAIRRRFDKHRHRAKGHE